MDVFDYGDFVNQLKSEGFDARGEVFDGQVGVIVGPKGLDPERLPPNEIGMFFPLWELNDEANEDLLAKRQFHEIVAKRPDGWSPFRR